jgi:hypothetical protein
MGVRIWLIGQQFHHVGSILGNDYKNQIYAKLRCVKANYDLCVLIGKWFIQQ